MTKLNSNKYFNVIMPFSADKDSDYKKEIIDSVGQKYGYRPIFPAYQNSHFEIQNLVEEYRKSKFVIVDLSFERPSCYFELGIAEAIGIEVHLFALAGTDIHQTSSREKVLFFNNLEHFELLLDQAIKVKGKSAQP